MADLEEVLPDFDTNPYRHLTYSLEKNNIMVSDLITLEPIDIIRRCPLPLGDLKALIKAIIKALHDELGVDVKPQISTSSDILASSNLKPSNGQNMPRYAQVVKTLDSKIDGCLGGGFYTGHITEIVGESAVGKTQFVMNLLLSCQLPPPHGLGRSAIYLSTEAPLNTNRLLQMLETNPFYQTITDSEKPTLDRVHTMSTNDLEVQEHIIQHQLPIAVQRFNVGLIVLDSVAANFRAEHETRTPKGMADRAVALTKLGNMLRAIARDHNVAIVVNNQVSDRFDDVKVSTQDKIRSSSPSLMSSSPAMMYRMLPPPIPGGDRQDDRLSLDHQQRFFTGWGDRSNSMYEQLKNPALGLAWANQLSARVVLKMVSERSNRLNLDYEAGGDGGNIWKDVKARRFISVVFAPWVAPTLNPVEYAISMQGPVSVAERTGEKDPDGNLLDPSLWLDGAVEDADEEFP